MDDSMTPEITAALEEVKRLDAPHWTDRFVDVFARGHESGKEHTDEQIAGAVRMLMRDDWNHEAICLMGRDRIARLSRENSFLASELERVRKENAWTPIGECPVEWENQWCVWWHDNYKNTLAFEFRVIPAGFSRDPKHCGGIFVRPLPLPPQAKGE